jgi:ATPase subunit of ABC transporter with duplicated ATPase domains
LYSLALLSLSNLLLRFTHGPAAASDRTRLQRERGAQREKERECVEKEREERTSEAQASAARFCEIERNEVDGQAKAKKKTDALKFEFTSNRKASAEQAPPLESISLSL